MIYSTCSPILEVSFRISSIINFVGDVELRLPETRLCGNLSNSLHVRLGVLAMPRLDRRTKGIRAIAIIVLVSYSK